MNEVTEAPSPSRSSHSTRAMALLLVAYIFNFVDRNIIGVLAVPIRTEFQLSDTALSTLGVAFGIFYALLAIPIAWAADRKNRVTIISAAVTIWSLFTAAGGLVNSFAQLIVARMGVAAGEAGGIAPSYSLISDYFPRHQRARAIAFFSLGIPIGSALGIFCGGWLASHLSWRTAFLIVGLAGLPAAIAIRLWVPEPVRGGMDPVPSAGPHYRRSSWQMLAKPALWLLSFGAALGSIPGYGLIFWLPSFFNRSFGLPLDQVGWFYGSVVLVGGILGTWVGGVIGDRLGPDRPGAYALIPALCFLLAVPIFAAGLFSPNLPVAWLLFPFGQMLTLAWLGPVVTAVQHLVPPSLRATTSATFLFINNLIGIAFGIFVLGFMSDRMKAAHGDDALRYSILYGLAFYLLSSLLYFIAARRLPRDWYGARESGC